MYAHRGQWRVCLHCPSFKKKPITNSIWQSPIIDNCIQWIRRRLETPAVLSLRTVSILYNERNVIQLTSWWRFELWKGTTHPSSTFRTKRKAYKLLWSDSHRGGVRYSIHSIRVRIWEISPIILFRFIRLGIWRERGGCLQNSLRQHDVNQLVEKDEDIKPFDSNSWAQQLNLQWEKHFEQREPPTEDKVIQVDIGDQTHPKLISIRKILSPGEKKNLISLIWDYIDVFA